MDELIQCALLELTIASHPTVRQFADPRPHPSRRNRLWHTAFFVSTPIIFVCYTHAWSLKMMLVSMQAGFHHAKQHIGHEARMPRENLGITASAFPG